jgi:RNA polymerase sigma-70 factor (sigma-E family)
MRPEMDEEFAQFVRSRQHRLLRAAYLVCGDRQVAEDLLHHALAKFAGRWEHVKSGQPDADLRRVLYRKAVASARRTGRAERAHGPFEEFGGEGSTWSSGDRVDLETALLQLPPRQRAVLVLRFFEDCSEAETAQALGMTTGAVTSQTADGLAHLRSLIPGSVDSRVAWEAR